MLLGMGWFLWTFSLTKLQSQNHGYVKTAYTSNVFSTSTKLMEAFSQFHNRFVESEEEVIPGSSVRAETEAVRARTGPHTKECDFTEAPLHL